MPYEKIKKEVLIAVERIFDLAKHSQGVDMEIQLHRGEEPTISFSIKDSRISIELSEDDI